MIEVISTVFAAIWYPVPSGGGARMKIYIDGKYCDQEDAKISVFDHGVLYGDGIFEGIRAYNGRIFRLEDHLQRLDESARAIHYVAENPTKAGLKNWPWVWRA